MTSARGPDRRLNAYRPDLADVRLKDVVVADRYVAGREGSIGVGAASVRSRPEATATQETQALFGEPVVVFESTPDWSWVQLQGDGYVGYIATAALARPFPPPTHRLIVPRSFIYPRADIKAPIADLLSLGTEVAVERYEGAFAALAVGGFVIAGHLVPIAAVGDFVGLAEQIVGTPYQWGGKTSVGLDCSGLVQIALLAAGRDSPRDSYMQEAGLGERIGEQRRHRPVAARRPGVLEGPRRHHG